MTARVDWVAVVVGAGITMALAVPAAITAQVLDARDSLDDDSAWPLLFAAVILASMGLGGYMAAIRRLDAPLLHAALAAVAAYVVVQGVGLVRRIAIGDDVSWVSIPFFLLLSAACGTAGGLWADHRARRPRR